MKIVAVWIIVATWPLHDGFEGDAMISQPPIHGVYATKPGCEKSDGFALAKKQWGGRDRFAIVRCELVQVQP